MKSEVHISVVSPVYGTKLDLPQLYQRLVDTISTITDKFEIILVNDNSPDNSWEVIQVLAKKDPRVRGVNLSRNFGQHYAVSAGLSFVRGEWCVVMDCDLQDQPEEIPKLYAAAKEGYDVVLGRRAKRRDNFAAKLTSRLFYCVFNYLTEQSIDNSTTNFGIFSIKVINSVNQFSERDRTFGMLVRMAGFKRTAIDIEHAERTTGKSAYTFKKRFDLAMDQILSHSNKPLRLAIRFGFLISLLAFMYATWLIYFYFAHGQLVSGWTSLIVTLTFLFGVNISVVGLVGLYVSKIYTQVKQRPLFIVESTTDSSNLN